MAKKKPSTPTTPPLLGSIFKPDPQEDFKGPESTVVDIQSTTVQRKFKKSQHLVNQILKDPSKDRIQIINLNQDIQERIRKSPGYLGETYSIIEGILLDESEMLLVDCLCKLLEQTSQKVDINDSNYYTGNKEAIPVEYGGKQTLAPRMLLSIYEITKEYIGGDKEVSGKHMKNVKKIIQKLGEKRFLIRYEARSRTVNNTIETRTFEEFKRLINIIEVKEEDDQGNSIDRGPNDVEVSLHPIFRHQIDKFHLLYPHDINKRTREAYGGKPKAPFILLRDTLMRELKHNRTEYTIYMDHLLDKLDHDSMKQGKKGRAKANVQKAINAAIAMGIVISYEITTGTTGEEKVIFNLNQKWV